MLFIICQGWGVSLNSLNIQDLGVLILSPSDLRPTLHFSLFCTESRLSSLGSRVSWLPDWFGTCEVLVGDEEEEKRERLSVSPLYPAGVGCPAVVHLLSDPSTHNTDPQVPAFIRWPWPWTQATASAVANLWITSLLPCQLDNHFLVFPPVNIWRGSCCPG